jgi:hypothetical protein
MGRLAPADHYLYKYQDEHNGACYVQDAVACPCNDCPEHSGCQVECDRFRMNVEGQYGSQALPGEGTEAEGSN